MKVQFRLNSKEVEILRRGEEIVLREKRGTGAQRADDREQRLVDRSPCEGGGIDAGHEQRAGVLARAWSKSAELGGVVGRIPRPGSRGYGTERDKAGGRPMPGMSLPRPGFSSAQIWASSGAWEAR